MFVILIFLFEISENRRPYKYSICYCGFLGNALIKWSKDTWSFAHQVSLWQWHSLNLNFPLKRLRPYLRNRYQNLFNANDNWPYAISTISPMSFDLTLKSAYSCFFLFLFNFNSFYFFLTSFHFNSFDLQERIHLIQLS